MTDAFTRPYHGGRWCSSVDRLPVSGSREKQLIKPGRSERKIKQTVMKNR